MIGIDAKTLHNHYRYELDHGHVKANAKVAENLFRKATGEGREAGDRRHFLAQDSRPLAGDVGARIHRRGRPTIFKTICEMPPEDQGLL